MDKDIITIQEVENDGQSIFLYYDKMAGVYLAYGLSAYYATMVTDPMISYSEEMMMPVVLLKRENILYLRQSLKKIDHTPKTYYRFRLRSYIGEGDYDRWAQAQRENFDKIYRR